MFERFTNGVVRALPHRLLPTAHAHRAIVRFNALRPDTVVAPLPTFVTPARPRRYTDTTMALHMATTMANLQRGLGAWDPGSGPCDPGRSLTATYAYELPPELPEAPPALKP